MSVYASTNRTEIDVVDLAGSSCKDGYSCRVLREPREFDTGGLTCVLQYVLTDSLENDAVHDGVDVRAGSMDPPKV